MQRYESMKKEFFINKRCELAKKIEDNSIALILSGEPVTSSGDQFFSFEVSRNFYYLTGTDIPYSVLFISKKANLLEEYLFVHPKDEAKEKWTGILPAPEEYTAISVMPVDQIKYIQDFSDFFSSKKKELQITSLYLDLKQNNENYDVLKPIYG